MFSDPQILAEVVTDATGSAEYRIAVLADLPPGPHTVTVIGVAPDGSDLLWVVPIVVAANGSLAEVRLGDDNAVAVPAVPSVGRPAGCARGTGRPRDHPVAGVPAVERPVSSDRLHPGDHAVARALRSACCCGSHRGSSKLLPVR